MPEKGRADLIPMRLGAAWLLGTYGLFLLVGETSRVPDLVNLTLYVASTVLLFAVGYWLRVRTWRPKPTRRHRPEIEDRETVTVRRWFLASAVFSAVFGVALLQAYGATGPGDIINAARNPGAAYFFRLRDAQLDSGNTVVQALTLSAALTTPLVPFGILFWDRLTPAFKIAGLIGVASYCSYWIFLGTQKGIGDYVAFAAIALLARGAIQGKKSSRRTKVILALVAAAFLTYMVFNQSDRLASERTTGGITPNPIATAVLGEDFGRGVTTTLFYPTHGYLGLAYNLDNSRFVWTEMRGSSRAFDSYWTQYLGGDSVFRSSYPARTEDLNGWPALSHWTTIYPWLASDLTFPGAALFMLVVGWLIATWWLETLHQRRKLSLLLVGQMAILLLYVPANNQLGITRSGLITFVTLIALDCLSRLSDAVGRARYPVTFKTRDRERAGAANGRGKR